MHESAQQQEKATTLFMPGLVQWVSWTVLLSSSILAKIWSADDARLVWYTFAGEEEDQPELLCLGGRSRASLGGYGRNRF
eukprot:7986094-Pyramimonas_sp.AAC.1